MDDYRCRYCRQKCSPDDDSYTLTCECCNKFSGYLHKLCLKTAYKKVDKVIHGLSIKCRSCGVATRAVQNADAEREC